MSGPSLEHLLATSLVLSEDWDNLTAEQRQQLERCAGARELVQSLADLRLLTPYQAQRIGFGKEFGLVLGNYRVLARLGTGGMGVVYKAEHLRMRRPVAIKVLSFDHEDDPGVLARFYSEIRAVAQLNHPNIVAAFDAGEQAGADPDLPVLYYFVMEYVEGLDLESYVRQNGPLAPAQACELMYQVASALAEAHRHSLVHRDIKPSNILVTPESQAKLLDFGLARQVRNRMTERGTVLGTVEYLAPEQARDASGVDIRADLFSLGGTLFWCLTGRPPFPAQSSMMNNLLARLTQPAPALRTFRPDLAPELEAVVGRMMALNPDDRYPTPQAVMRALLMFLHRQEPGGSGPLAAPPHAALADPARGSRLHRVLVVDDEADIRAMCRYVLQFEEIDCAEAASGPEALDALASRPHDLVLLDIDMPEMSGIEVCKRLRNQPPSANLKIVFFSGRTAADDMARLLLSGADDYLTKPFTLVELLARIKASLRLKEAQDRTDLLHKHLLGVNAELESNLTARDSDLVHARNALVLALAKVVEQRHTETGAHLARIQRYSRCLAEEAARLPQYAGAIDLHFIQMLECCAPLHDIGKVALPDHILMKPGKLTPDERIQMQEHTVIGAQTLQEVASQHGSALVFLGTAIDIARHHHERFDGTGYPDRLAGASIPLSARLVALADVYDALRSRRVYKPALSHSAALQIMTGASEGQFDPGLIPALLRAAPRLEAIYRELADQTASAHSSYLPCFSSRSQAECLAAT